jgi:hypothetical protein
MVFDPKTVTATRIKADAEYTGVRVLFAAFLGKAKIKMQIDVGFGDVVTPEAKKIVTVQGVALMSEGARSPRRAA